MSDLNLVVLVNVFLRLLPIFVVAPVVGLRNVPVLVRLVFTLSLAFILGLVLPDSPGSLTQLEPAVMVSEFVLGVALALVFHLVAGVLHFYGQLVDAQVGFAAASMFDPSLKQSTGIFATLVGLCVGATFFLADMHYMLLSAFKMLYVHVPIGSTFELQAGWYSMVGKIFLFGFVVASPVILLVLLFDTALAYLSRSLPQVQIYFVGLPIKILLGILAMSWYIKTLLQPLLELFIQGLYSWDGVLRV